MDQLKSTSGFFRFRGIMAAFLFFVCFCTVSAQTDYSISGNATEAGTENPLFGVALQVEGTSSGGTTDVEGNLDFTVTLGSEEQYLLVTRVGYVSQRVLLTPGTDSALVVNVELDPDIMSPE